MVYITPAEVRTITGITSTESDDTALTSIITYATAQVNGVITAYVENEIPQYINAYKENEINGVDKIFYVSHYPLADFDDDGDVDTSDVKVYLIEDDTRTAATVSSIDAIDGKIVLTTAPTTVQDVWITYKYYLLKDGSSSGLIKLAVAWLSASIVQSKVDVSFIGNIKLGEFGVGNRTGKTGYTYYKERYNEILDLINREIIEVMNLDISTENPDILYTKEKGSTRFG